MHSPCFACVVPQGTLLESKMPSCITISHHYTTSMHDTEAVTSNSFIGELNGARNSVRLTPYCLWNVLFKVAEQVTTRLHDCRNAHNATTCKERTVPRKAQTKLLVNVSPDTKRAKSTGVTVPTKKTTTQCHHRASTISMHPQLQNVSSVYQGRGLVCEGSSNSRASAVEVMRVEALMPRM